MLGYPNARPPATPSVGAGQALTAKRSVRLLDPQGGTIHSPTSIRTSTPPQVYDPPRVPKEGYEWVWFPAGYWAERVIAEMPSTRKPESCAWPFRWSSKRPAKERTNSWSQESLEAHPQTPIESPLSPPPKPRQMPPLASPYLSEAAHVQSLQQPEIYQPRHISSSGSDYSLREINVMGNKPKDPVSTPWPGVSADDSSPQRRSYFQFGASGEDSMLLPTNSISNRVFKQPSLSPKTSDATRVVSLRAPQWTHFGRPSNESVSKDSAHSSLISSREQESSTEQYPIAQTQADEVQKLAPSDIGLNEAKPKQSFMRKLVWETKPKVKKVQLQSGMNFNTVASVIEEVKPQLDATQSPVLTTDHVTLKLRDDEKGDHPPKSRSRKLFGKTPKIQRTSARSSISASGSSVRNLLRGRTPEATPSVQIEAYFPPSELYPGGEARRVKTPPLRETTTDGHPRSFFFDITTPSASSNGPKRRCLQPQTSPPHLSISSDDNSNDGLPYGVKQQPKKRLPLPSFSASHLSDPGGKQEQSFDSNSRRLSQPPSPPPPPPRSVTKPSQDRPLLHHNVNFVPKPPTRQPTANLKEWWEVPVPTPSYEDMAPGAFSFDLPEHLPTSPMCPANKRHKSGGTGVCVYHGRRKMSFDGDGCDDEGKNSEGGGGWW